MELLPDELLDMVCYEARPGSLHNHSTLRNPALVSHRFYNIALPHLYHFVAIDLSFIMVKARKSEEKRLANANASLYETLTSQPQIRRLVKQLRVSAYIPLLDPIPSWWYTPRDMRVRDPGPMDRRLCALLSHLDNLEELYALHYPSELPGSWGRNHWGGRFDCGPRFQGLRTLSLDLGDFYLAQAKAIFWLPKLVNLSLRGGNTVQSRSSIPFVEWTETYQNKVLKHLSFFLSQDCI